MFRYDAPIKIKMEPIDDSILLAVHKRMSLTETALSVSRSTRGVRLRLQALEKLNYLTYIPRKARSRMLTQKGIDYLKENGLIKE